MVLSRSSIKTHAPFDIAQRDCLVTIVGFLCSLPYNCHRASVTSILKESERRSMYASKEHTSLQMAGLILR
eukprot:6200338-Pleurochrysis_carterae.AAC.4